MTRQELIARLHNAKKDCLSFGECWNLMDDPATGQRLRIR